MTLNKSSNEQILLLNRTILNISHNFIPNKIILCDDRDPPWMNERIEHLIKKKKDIYYKEQKESDKYHERLAVKLSDPKTAPKT